MKTKNNIDKESRKARSPFILTIKRIVCVILILSGVQSTLMAQEQVQPDVYTPPTWWWGVAGGANLNYYSGTTQQLNSGLTVPAAFHDGKGLGLFLAPLVEFHKPDSRWGGMLQVGFDSRKGKFDQVTTPCNCPADLAAKVTYITVEPNLRFAPFKSNFYLFGGPRLAFNMGKSFTYELGINPAIPSQPTTPDVKGDFSSMKSTIFSMQIGAGYDIALSSKDKATQYVLSPFVSLHPYFGQHPRSIESWSLTTIRVGLALKFGKSHKEAKKEEIIPVKEVVAPIIVAVEPTVKFTVYAPANVQLEYRVREIFPVRNYIFFDLGSNVIPDRYVLLTKDQVKDFKEDQLEVFTPKKLSGRSDRQMTVYYSILNILGDRMVKNPKTIIILRGASMQCKKDGKAMAESVKKYLVNIFGVNSSRITTEGRIKPIIASEQPGGTKELVLLREGDRRVSIATTSPELLMEFQSGTEAPLKPVQIDGVQQQPISSYVSCRAKGANEALTSWTIELSNEKGIVQKFGPFTDEDFSFPAKTVLGEQKEGTFKVEMIGITKTGNTVRKDTTIMLHLWTQDVREEGMRFSVIYEINSLDAIAIYEKYLTEIVTPKIPINGTVILKGHTDIIGNPENNKALSLARANDVKSILEHALAKANRTDVKFEVYGCGEDTGLAPFANNFPEERFYNRTVVIDLIPPVK